MRNGLTLALQVNMSFVVCVSHGQKELMRIARQSRAQMLRPALAAWWLRLLMAALFVVHINYLHYHLLSETHLDQLQAASIEDHEHEDGADDGDHHDSDHHQPHAAADHQLQMLFKHQSPLLTIYFLASENSFFVTRPDSLVVRIFCERLKPPGESPPDPLQPRAPPLA
jgi:hypothetical protein